jgi:hypothetical protein
MDLAEASNIATLVICFCTVTGLFMATCAGCIQIRVNKRSKEIEVMGNIISLRDQSEMATTPANKKTRFSVEAANKIEAKEPV